MFLPPQPSTFSSLAFYPQLLVCPSQFLSSSVRDPMVSVTSLPQTFHFLHPVEARGPSMAYQMHYHGRQYHLWPLRQPLFRWLLLRTPFPIFRIRAVRLNNYTDRLYNWMSVFDTYLDTHYLLFCTHAIPTSLWPLAGSIGQCRSHQMDPALTSPWKLICDCFLFKCKPSPHLPDHPINLLAVDVVQPLFPLGQALSTSLY